MGEFSSALAAYSRAADLAPGIAGYRLRQAELLFQNNRAHDADVMMRGIVRKNPSYAGRLTRTYRIRLTVAAFEYLTSIHFTHENLAVAAW
jgi:hypothetical protein